MSLSDLYKRRTALQNLKALIQRWQSSHSEAEKLKIERAVKELAEKLGFDGPIADLEANVNEALAAVNLKIQELELQR